MKKLIASATIAIASYGVSDTQAMGVSIDGERQCDFELNYTVKSKPGYLMVLDQGEKLYKISDDGVLYHKGKAVEQNRLQRRTNVRFKEELESLPVEIMTLTLEAMEIAFVSLAATMDMFGLDNEEFQKDLKSAMEKGRTKLESRLVAGQESWTMGPDSFKLIGDDAFGPEFEREVEVIAEKYAGKIALGALTAAFTDAEGIEQKAEQIEAMVEARAEEIEGSASELCDSIRAIAEHEALMRKAVPELSELPLLEEK